MTTTKFEIIEIRVEKGVDLGSVIKDSLLPNVVLLGGDLFYRFMFCKWTTSIIYSTWVICQ